MKEQGDSFFERHNMCQIDLEHVPFMKAKHSTVETKHFVKERRDPLLIMTIWVMSTQCWTRWTWTSEFQGCDILLWSMGRVTSLRDLIQKIENHPDRHALQQHLRQNQAYSTFSPESKNDSENEQHRIILNSSRRNPKRSAQHSFPTGT